MQFNNKTYDVMKWIVQTFLPALIALVGGIGAATNFEYTEITMTILAAVTTFLGTLIGVSNHNYKKGE